MRRWELSDPNLGCGTGDYTRAELNPAKPLGNSRARSAISNQTCESCARGVHRDRSPDGKGGVSGDGVQVNAEDPRHTLRRHPGAGSNARGHAAFFAQNRRRATRRWVCPSCCARESTNPALLSMHHTAPQDPPRMHERHVLVRCALTAYRANATRRWGNSGSAQEPTGSRSAQSRWPYGHVGAQSRSGTEPAPASVAASTRNASAFLQCKGATKAPPRCVRTAATGPGPAAARSCVERDRAQVSASPVSAAVTARVLNAATTKADGRKLHLARSVQGASSANASRVPHRERRHLSIQAEPMIRGWAPAPGRAHSER